MDDLNNWIINSELDDLRFIGHMHTWTNISQGQPSIAKKLDRVIVNTHWLSSFPNSTANFAPPLCSDHCPMLVDIGVPTPRRKCPFKFFDFWCEHPNFLTTVASVWNTEVSGVPMYRVTTKLKRLKSALKNLNHNVFSDISSRVKNAKFNLTACQNLLDSDPGNIELRQQERDLLLTYSSLSKVEEQLFQQKSRVKWLALGLNSLSPFISKSVNTEFHDILCSIPTDVEIMNCMFSIKSKKSPGLDGYNSFFFKKAWSIVGRDVTLAIRDFFQFGKIFKQVNATYLALIPKVPNPSSPSEYRPITCCSVLYKCISKLIVNKLKPIMPTLIDKAQNAFVSGRKIGDNIILAQELLRGYHRDLNPPRCTLKVDLIKAYDTLSWQFILDVLQLMQFPPIFISWIKACISTASFSICINGELCGFFNSIKGLRQGGSSISLPLRSGNGYDILIFCHGNVRSAQSLKVSIDTFTNLSSLTPNPNKSNLFFSGTPHQTKNTICNIFQFPCAELLVKYLGLPLISIRLTTNDYQSIIDSMLSRVTSWTARALSFVERLQLIQATLFSMHIYWTNLLILPAKVCDKMNQLMQRFLWSGKAMNKYRTKVEWEHMCNPKHAGGLGIYDIQLWNKASILRHNWTLCSNDSTGIWKEWTLKNLVKNKSLWDISIPSDSSWFWRKLLQNRTLAQPFVKHILNNGSSTMVFFDNWLPCGPLYQELEAKEAKTGGRNLSLCRWSVPELGDLTHLRRQGSSQLEGEFLSGEDKGFTFIS
ncbi:uncharacterized protein LOC132309616 [Cornus florida]|uniref:uncharacterized protein LOC132309616 n=1 Tax=Cornus florida TaxID=4283 RepID=UPI002899B736|nr:uncharacterized protein LOC132309616 [Cornus florida]